MEPDEGTAFQGLSEVKDFGRETIIECDRPECPYAITKTDLSDNIIVQETKAGYLRLKTSTKNPRWLIYSESNLPTWEARINGDLTTIYTSNYLYQAVFIPPGENDVTFEYPGILEQMKYAAAGFFDRTFDFMDSKSL